MEFSRPLEWVDFPFTRGSSQPRDRTQVSLIAGGFFTSWATREACLYMYILLKQQAPNEITYANLHVPQDLISFGFSRNRK